MGCCRQWGAWAWAAREAEQAPSGTFPGTGEACCATHGAGAAPVSVKMGAGCPWGVSAFLPPSCSECGGDGNPSRFSFTRGEVSAQQQVRDSDSKRNWRGALAGSPEGGRGGDLCRGRPRDPRGSPHAGTDPRTPGVPPHTGAFPIPRQPSVAGARPPQLPGAGAPLFARGENPPAAGDVGDTGSQLGGIFLAGPETLWF